MDIYKLALHEVSHNPSGSSVTRVPGGWIYSLKDHNGNLVSSTFVPFHNEFQEVEPQPIPKHSKEWREGQEKRMQQEKEEDERIRDEAFDTWTKLLKLYFRKP
jgi:hypothetical protein